MNVINSFYDAVGYVKKAYGINLPDYMLFPKKVKEVEESRGVGSHVKVKVLEPITPKDNVCCLEFRMENKENVATGMYLYRENKNGYEVIGGSTIILDKNKT